MTLKDGRVFEATLYADGKLYLPAKLIKSLNLNAGDKFIIIKELGKLTVIKKGTTYYNILRHLNWEDLESELGK